jgi:FkbM family methyltransferase
MTRRRASWLPTLLSRLRRRRRVAASHGIFERFATYDGWAESGYERGYYGINIRDWLYTGESKGYIDRRHVHVAHPPIDEEYFEWIALMSAVVTARGSFCFAEIGGGWGRWMVTAAALCRQQSIPFRLIGVEAERSHFEWIKYVFRDNDIDPALHQLWYGAAADRDGDILLSGPDPPEKVWGHRIVRPHELPSWESLPGYKITTVPGFKLATILAAAEHVDLMDVDIQGVEHDIITPAIEMLNAKVGAVHIGTHSTEAEKSLRKAFRKNGWLNAFSHPHHSEVNTDFGRVYFTDGVQTWVNPKRPELYAAMVDG